MPALTSHHDADVSGVRAPDAPQHRLASQLVHGLEAVETAIDALVGPMSTTRRTETPPDGGWSVDEILEHLCLANGDYLTAMERAIDHSSAPFEHGRWHPTLGGRLLVRAMESERRSSAPRRIVPAATARPDVLRTLLLSLAHCREVVERTRALEWRRVRLSSPYARWLRLNLGDAALVVLRHAERHLRQLSRVASSVSR